MIKSASKKKSLWRHIQFESTESTSISASSSSFSCDVTFCCWGADLFGVLLLLPWYDVISTSIWTLLLLRRLLARLSAWKIISLIVEKIISLIVEKIISLVNGCFSKKNSKLPSDFNFSEFTKIFTNIFFLL